jgi:hypothetical protein
MATTQEATNGARYQTPTETGCGRTVKPDGNEHPRPNTIIVWRRLNDGGEFAGTFVRDIPEHYSIIVANLSDGHQSAVHRSNIIRAQGECSECGESIEPGYPHRAFKECCFSCSCWRETLAADVADERPFAVVDGTHYTFRDDPTVVGRGSGGRPYVILFTDGRSASTRNLWCQGAVPAHFRSRFPDNATSVVEARVRGQTHA